MLCREILEGFRKTGDPFAPAPFPRPLGAGGFCASLAQIFFVSFFWLPSSGKPECAKRFFAMCETVFCADSRCADFCADFWCADFSTFWRLENRYSRVTQKNAQKICGVQMALLGGVPHSSSAFLSRQHVTQSPLGRRTQGEHARVHRDIFGLKGMLAFAQIN